MALSASTVWEVRTAGHEENGGGYVSGGTDWSQQDSPQYSVANAVTNGTTTVTSATANFGTDVVGNIVLIAGGTAPLGNNRYQIISRTNSTTIVVDRTIAASTGCTLKIGGAIVHPGLLINSGPTNLVAGMSIYIKAGTYAMVTAVAGSNGSVFAPGVRVRVEGYQTTRGDLGTPPLFQASVMTSFSMVTLVDGCAVLNINVDGAGQATGRGWTLASVSLFKCKALNCTNSGFFGTDVDTVGISCLATGCSTTGAAFNNGNWFGCIAHTNSVDGFLVGQGQTLSQCISYGNTGAGSDGFQMNSDGGRTINCVAYGNAGAGFNCSNDAITNINCIAEGNTGAGFATSATAHLRIYCATYNNTGGATSGTFAYEVGNIAGTTGSFFTNAAGADFTLNNTSNQGALLRGTGFPGTMIS